MDGGSDWRRTFADLEAHVGPVNRIDRGRREAGHDGRGLEIQDAIEFTRSNTQSSMGTEDGRMEVGEMNEIFVTPAASAEPHHHSDVAGAQRRELFFSTTANILTNAGRGVVLGACGGVHSGVADWPLTDPKTFTLIWSAADLHPSRLPRRITSRGLDAAIQTWQLGLVGCRIGYLALFHHIGSLLATVNVSWY